MEHGNESVAPAILFTVNLPLPSSYNHVMYWMSQAGIGGKQVI